MKNETRNNGNTPSRENYLKALLELSENNEIRSVDIAHILGVSKASVSCMLNRLKDQGYISKKKYGTVILTEKGISESENIKKRYDLLKTFFVKALEVDPSVAADDACRIEHIISEESIRSINIHLEGL